MGYILWRCQNNVLWALDRIYSKKTCDYKRRNKCAKPCSGFPDQKWRDTADG